MNLVVLAGGQSKRMGHGCKHHDLLGGMPLYEHVLVRLGSICEGVVVVENAGYVDLAAHAGMRVVPDMIANTGPLGGIYSGLVASTSWLNFVIGADMPYASPQLAAAMETYALQNKFDIVYPNIGGLLEPLFAIYSQRVGAVALDLLNAGCRSVRELFSNVQLSVGVVDRRFVTRYDKQLMSFFNINTPDDLIMARLMMDVNEKSLQEERV
ncbi:MAG: molybdenum cofactor guanylyltransferase [Candidatus Cryosericum sp.]